MDTRWTCVQVSLVPSWDAGNMIVWNLEWAELVVGSTRGGETDRGADHHLRDVVFAHELVERYLLRVLPPLFPIFALGIALISVSLGNGDVPNYWTSKVSTRKSGAARATKILYARKFVTYCRRQTRHKRLSSHTPRRTDQGGLSELFAIQRLVTCV